jgi:hypothetical protein
MGDQSAFERSGSRFAQKKDHQSKKVTRIPEAEAWQSPLPNS